MRRIHLTMLFLSFAFNLYSEEKTNFEITSRIAAVGGNGEQELFIETNTQGKISIFIYYDNYGSSHEKIYNACEKYLLMKMERGYSKVRIINAYEIKLTSDVTAISLDEKSYCMLQN